MKSKGRLKNSNRSEDVDLYLQLLQHPLKAEIEATRHIIKNASPKIFERIKWNAPSFFYKEDIVTFNPRNTKLVQLVFHHPSIVSITSPLLLGDYKDRRLLHLSTMKEVKSGQKEIENILNQLIKNIDQKSTLI